MSSCYFHGLNRFFSLVHSEGYRGTFSIPASSSSAIPGFGLKLLAIRSLGLQPMNAARTLEQHLRHDTPPRSFTPNVTLGEPWTVGS
jgi:hypothetical protein